MESGGSEQLIKHPLCRSSTLQYVKAALRLLVGKGRKWAHTMQCLSPAIQDLMPFVSVARLSEGSLQDGDGDVISFALTDKFSKQLVLLIHLGHIQNSSSTLDALVGQSAGLVLRRCHGPPLLINHPRFEYLVAIGVGTTVM